jgi:hypothetical protein
MNIEKFSTPKKNSKEFFEEEIEDFKNYRNKNQQEGQEGECEALHGQKLPVGLHQLHD